MSEYQYYEFQAIDRRLTDQEMNSLRGYSSRAEITPSSFAVSYSWGDFKGDPAAWMGRYFDAFLYLANWGTHELRLSLPESLLPLGTVEPYCLGDALAARAKRDRVVLRLRSEGEGEGGWIDEGGASELLPRLIPLREELAAGDLRPLYLAWLQGAQVGGCGEEVREPPCPPGLGALSAAQEALAEFLRLDLDLVEAAAAGSPEPTGAGDADALRRWIAALPEQEKTALLVRVVEGEDALLPAELRRRCRESRGTGSLPPERPARTVGELLRATEQCAERRREAQAKCEAQERARHARREAVERERRLDALAPREAQAWQEVEALVESKKPRSYEAAVALLTDLHALGVREERRPEVEARLFRLRARHERKSTFVQRLAKARLFG